MPIPRFTRSDFSRRELFVCLALALAFVAIRGIVFANASPIEFPDSDSYLDKARENMWTSEFYLGSGRFVVVPLAYKLVGAVGDMRLNTLTSFQLWFSLSAWLVLAWSVLTSVQPAALALFGFAVVLALGASADVAMWDRVILSESISISTFVLFVASWLKFAQRPCAVRVAWCLACGALWSYSREANSLLLLPFGAALACAAMWYRQAPRRARRLALTGAAGCVLIFATTSYISGRGDRWVFPLLNVIGQRVLTSPERTAYYAARGMPVTERLLAMEGEFASGQNWAFYEAAELEGFRDWLLQHGRKVFASDLASHPLRTIREPVPDAEEFVDPELAVYRAPGFVHDWPDLWRVMTSAPRGAMLCILGSLVAGTIFVVVSFRARYQPSMAAGLKMLTPAVMLLGWIPFTWFTWQVIGNMEIGRHVLAGTLVFRVGCVLAILYLLEALASSLSKPRREAASGARDV